MNRPYLVVTCPERVHVTFFLPEESDGTRLGTLPFPLVFGFRKMIAIGYFLMGRFSLVGVTTSFPRRMIVDKVKYVYYCFVTSADFVCSVRGVV